MSIVSELEGYTFCGYTIKHPVARDMNLVKGNINFTNEMIDSMKPGEKSETLNDLF